MILAVDTSGKYAVVAAVDPSGRLPFAGSGVRPRGHGEELACLVHDALAAGSPELVVAGRGPGSFTGLRVGLCFAQVFAWARDLPVTGLCSLDVVAEAERLQDGWVVMDARRGEVYLAKYADGLRQGDAEVCARADALVRTSADRVVGDVELLTATDRRAAGRSQLDPAALGRCARRAVTAGSQGDVTPLYLRRPDVTMPGGRS